MLHTIRTTLMAACVFMIAGSLLVGCGSGECVKDADCNKDGKTGMICKLDLKSGKRSCEKKTVLPPDCPESCLDDGDCADCSDGKTKCVNLVCSKPPSQCPDSCSDDSDCAQCEDGKTA